MLDRYDQRLCERFNTRKKSHFFNSFFMVKLLKTKKMYDYNEVASWTNKVNVFEMEKLIFPINTNNNHWTLACVYIPVKEIHYFDTYIEVGNEGECEYTDKSDYYMGGLIMWIIDEGKRRGEIQTEEGWSLINRSHDIPQQGNHHDCGVFTIVCADFLTDNLLLEYSQNDMPFWRKKIGIDILRGQLRY